jgi:hypothetical protein
MENQKQVLKRSEGSAKGMFEFFYAEFQHLRAKTGIRQWEQLNEAPDAAKVIHDVIDFMCQECNKPPFDIVRSDVKQRVISRAIVEDGDFIGLNAKFVRKALNAWWLSNGDRMIEAMNQKEAEVYQVVDLTDEQKKNIDNIANKYIAQLLQADGPKVVPQMEKGVAQKEGAEWKSELERKAVSVKYQPPPDEFIQTQDRIRKAGSEFYRGRFDLHLKIFNVNKHQIFAESMSDAEQIYQTAMEVK